MNNETIILLVCIIIGAAIFFIGTHIRNKWCIIIGACFIIGVLITTLVRPTYSEYREALNALSSGVAVFIAAIALYLNFQMRDDSLKKEDRDRKERWLNDILQWIKDIDNTCEKELMNNYFGLGEKKHGPLTTSGTINILHRYEVDIVTSGDLSTLLRHGLYLINVCRGLNENKLEEYIQGINELIDERFNLLKSRHKPEILDPIEELKQQEQALECIDDETKSINNLNTYWKTSVLLTRNLKSLGSFIDNINNEISTLKTNLLSSKKPNQS